MKRIFFIIILSFVFACTKKVDKYQTNKDKDLKEIVVYLKANFILQNKQLLSFIDSYIERCQTSNIVDSVDVDNYFYLLYIYQNDFFTRVKLSFISPSNNLLKYLALGTGYFEYKGRVFIIITGLDRLCTPDSSLQKELQNKYINMIKNNDEQVKVNSYKIELLQPFTWEADLVADTIFIRRGTINPCDPPPADTTALYKYIRSIKSFTR